MKGRKPYLRALLGIASFAVLLASPAGAHTQTRLDPDDSPGKVDIVVARHAHRSTDSGIKLRFRLVTYETWSFKQDHPRIGVEFDLNGDGYADRCVVVGRRWVEPDGFRVEGYVYKWCSYFDDPQIGTAKVTRPDEHSLTVSMAKRLLGKTVRSYKWRILTGYQDPESEECKPFEPSPGLPPPHGGYGEFGTCRDFSAWIRHSFEVDDD